MERDYAKALSTTSVYTFEKITKNEYLCQALVLKKLAKLTMLVMMKLKSFLVVNQGRGEFRFGVGFCEKVRYLEEI